MNIAKDILGSGKYTSMLPLSYMVPTFYPTPSGNVQPQSGAPQILLSDPDLQARAQRLVNVLYWTAQAYSDQDGMADGNTLKVFIAPEFYFRKASSGEVDSEKFDNSTSFGSYPEDARYKLAEALYGVIQDSPLFKDWVIVAGTICSALPAGLGGRMNLLNTAIMMRGQRASADDSVPYILMEKHYISNIDGPHWSSHANLDPTTTYSFNLNPDQVVDNLVYWDDMKLGLEVCLDHDKQVALNAVNLLAAAVGPVVGRLDLQLVTSCGMSIVNQAVAVADGALVMLTDGYSSRKYQLREPLFQLGRYNAATGLTTVFDLGEFQFAELPLNGNYQVDYAGGRYGELKRRQGVWAKTSKVPLSKPGVGLQA